MSNTPYTKIIYTYFNRGVEDEQEMLVGQLSLPEAVIFTRQMAHVQCLQDFEIKQVFTETDAGWEEVPNWEEIENEYRKKKEEKAQ